MSILKNPETPARKKRKAEEAEDEWEEIEELDDSEEEEEEEERPPRKRRRSVVVEDEDEDVEDEDDEEDDEEEEKTRRKKKSKRFPFGGLIFMFILIGIVLAAGYYGMGYYEQLQALNGQYDAAREEATAELAAAQEEYFLADPDSPANTDIRQELTDVLLADAREQVKELEGEEAELDASIHEKEEALKVIEGQENFDYYKEIYDEYVEGGEYVEELLSGN